MDIKDPFAVSFTKTRGAIPGILAKFQIPALTYRGAASAALPHPQLIMLIAALCCTGKKDYQTQMYSIVAVLGTACIQQIVVPR